MRRPTTGETALGAGAPGEGGGAPRCRRVRPCGMPPGVETSFDGLLVSPAIRFWRRGPADMRRRVDEVPVALRCAAASVRVARPGRRANLRRLTPRSRPHHDDHAEGVGTRTCLFRDRALTLWKAKGPRLQPFSCGACRARTGDPQLANSVGRWSEWVGDGRTPGNKRPTPLLQVGTGQRSSA